jgi:penicillin-binding protein 1A
MPRNKYSWEDAPGTPLPKKRKIWRWLLLIPLLLVFIAAGAAGFFLLSMRAEFMEMARQFDLNSMTRMESASQIYDREGKLLGKIFIQNRNPVPYDKLPASLVQAVVATEDQKFWEHQGVDIRGIIRAAQANWMAGRIRQGASTVTQQLARNSFDLKERTYRRKLLEMALAYRIEQQFSKEQIMEMYLNRVYFGGGLYGAESAARGYFGVPAAEMSAAQSATLAGLLKSPNSLSPWTNPKASQVSRDYVLGQMHEQGFLDDKEYRQALAEPLKVMKRPDPIRQSYALDYVRQQAINALGFERAMNGGFRIFTTLDSTLQTAAEDSLARKLREVETRPGYANQTYDRFARMFEANPPKPGASNTKPPSYIQGAVLAMDNKTGGILVMVGGRDFRHSEYNRSVQGRRPVGTAFVPLVFAAAFEKGLFPGDVVQDWALDNRLVGIGGSAGILGEWGVERADNEYEGDLTIREALVRGKNSAAVRVGFQTGLESLKKITEKAGVRSPLRPYANSYLGTSEATLEEMTVAYSSFPGMGSRPEKSHIIDRIVDAEGSVVYEQSGKRVDVFSDATAWQVHSMMSDSLVRGTGSKAMTDYGLTVAGAAGKTGTAYNFTDVWFLGYTDRITCGVWIGYDKPAQIFRGAFSSDLALPVWVDVINATRKNFPATPLKAPLTVEKVEICRVSGQLATDKCIEKIRLPDGSEAQESTVFAEYARIGRAPTGTCNVHAGGIKTFAREFSEEEWPRAMPAQDLSMIPPVNVSSSAVVGADPYNSISMASLAALPSDVPRAEAVSPVAFTETITTPGAKAPEVRPAGAAGVSAGLSAEEAEITITAPPPIRF